jgi:hypothetical protein
MRHIELVLTDNDIELTMASLKTQAKAFEGLIKKGELPPGEIESAKNLISTFNSLWWKYHWALNPKGAKK